MTIQGRRFPPRNKVISSPPDENGPLQLLGRRVERLFFTGLLITGLAFGEVYVTAATYQLSQDKNSAAVVALLDSIQANMPKLKRLFEESARPKSDKASSPQLLRVQKAEIDQMRAALGIRPARPTERDGAARVAVGQSYSDVLNGLVMDAIRKSDVDYEVMRPFDNAEQSPDQLQKSLLSAAAASERQTLVVLGIRAPRLIAIDYAGSNFVFPYEVLSVIGLVILTPLIPGWLSALYMTRQREMREIQKAAQFTLVFPHVLNFVPVAALRAGVTQAEIDAARIIAVVFQAIVRLAVILVVVSPVLFAYVVSLAQFSKFSTLSDIIWFFGIYIAFQSLFLVLQEVFGLGGKVFWERAA